MRRERNDQFSISFVVFQCCALSFISKVSGIIHIFGMLEDLFVSRHSVLTQQARVEKEYSLGSGSGSAHFYTLGPGPKRMFSRVRVWVRSFLYIGSGSKKNILPGPCLGPPISIDWVRIQKHIQSGPKKLFSRVSIRNNKFFSGQRNVFFGSEYKTNIYSAPKKLFFRVWI